MPPPPGRSNIVTILNLIEDPPVDTAATQGVTVDLCNVFDGEFTDWVGLGYGEAKTVTSLPDHDYYHWNVTVAGGGCADVLGTIGMYSLRNGTVLHITLSMDYGTDPPTLVADETWYTTDIFYYLPIIRHLQD